jgi:hypothetical protein
MRRLPMSLWKWLATLALIVAASGATIWIYNEAIATAPTQPPPFDLVPVTSRLYIGSQTLDPMPGDVQVSLDAESAAKIAVDFDPHFPGQPLLD